MITGDLLRFTVRYTVLGQLCLNVFYYVVKSTNVAGSLQDALVAFSLQFQTSYEDIVSNQATFDQLDVENVTDGVSFASTPLLWSGNESGSAMSAYYAAGVRLNRASKITRNGYKRIAGLAEPSIANGDYESGYLNRLSAFADDCATDITQTPFTDLVDLQPVIASFNADGTLRATNAISSAVPYGPTTQNSRKPDFST